ncbi:cupin domain-containing protein [Deinococcus detaillensis]|uniref:Cupin domain-containing protein n=1 Tax=Deinococcus detaillensis TaxID=2592048 RepID=A0A553V4Q4_9DEIO|nr:cupin domain-containing protein [Deinococcus detaillensis]TSA87191.1 cupin domain-containing protein [Deinococcus detaillensis]
MTHDQKQNQQSQYKLSRSETQHGKDGQHHLIKGEKGSVRLWHNEEPSANSDTTLHSHAYETLGYVVSGRMELVLSGQTIALEAGDSYCVPSGAEHRFHILETLTAVETTTPSAF